MYRMEKLETKTTNNGGFERGDNSTGSAGLIEERVDGLQLPKSDVSDGH